MAGNRRHISRKLKELILKMRKHPGMSTSKIQELTGVSSRTQYRVAALMQNTGEVVQTPVAPGRPRILNSLDVAVSILSEKKILAICLHLLQFLDLGSGCSLMRAIAIVLQVKDHMCGPP